MKVLIGSTNQSKIEYYQQMLQSAGVECLTLAGMGIATEPEETGSTPEENARIKAAFYGRYHDLVVCNDSGLYLDPLPLDDPRQPGLHVRTPGGGPRLSDAEMVSYYTSLARDMGGCVMAYYLNGFAVYRKGKVISYMESRSAKRKDAFYLMDHVVAQGHPGWPLDSISRWNPREQTEEEAHEARSFVLQALGITI